MERTKPRNTQVLSMIYLGAVDLVNEPFDAMACNPARKAARSASEHGRVLEASPRWGLVRNGAGYERDSSSRLPRLPVIESAPITEHLSEVADNPGDGCVDETREKRELLEWADRMCSLDEAEFELALDQAVLRFKRGRATLRQLVKGRRKRTCKQADSAAETRNEEAADVHYYGVDFKVSSRGVFARQFDKKGKELWKQISTTRIDLLALTRDVRGQDWGTYIAITDRDGVVKNLAIPHALMAAERVKEIYRPSGVRTPTQDAGPGVHQYRSQPPRDRVAPSPATPRHSRPSVAR
jgi:Domain of unknown function (DUF927)